MNGTSRPTFSQPLPWGQLHNIQTFVALSAYASFAKASTALHRATSAIARSTALLEKALGCDLVERTGRGILLTAAGRLVIARGERIMAEVTAAAQTLRDAAPDRRPSLNATVQSLLGGRRLELLIDLDGSHSISRSASHLGMSQSAASMVLTGLEATAGLSLYRRLPRGLSPLPSAYRLTRHARRVAAELRHLMNEINSLTHGIAGVAVVGFLAMARTRIGPAAIAHVLDQHPHLHIRALDWPFDPLVEGLRSGDVDFTVGVMRDAGEHSGLEVEPLMDDDLCLLVRAGHPRLQRGISDIAALKAARWIMPRRQSHGARAVRAAFERQGCAPPEPAVETADLQIMRHLLFSSDMIAVASPFQWSVELEGGLLVRLPIVLGEGKREIVMLRRQGARLSAGAECLMEAIRKEAAALKAIGEGGPLD